MMDAVDIKNRTEGPFRIAVFRALQLGDLLCSVPAFRSLRTLWPDAEISLIGLPWARSFVERFSRYVDGFIEFPGFPGLPERDLDVRAFPGFIAEMQRSQFDLIIQMHGSGNLVNSMCVLMGSRRLAGYYVPGEYCPNPDNFIAYPDSLPEIQRHLALVRSLGAPTDDELEFPLTPKDHEELKHSIGEHRISRGQYVCLHPGGRYPSRRWLPDRFAAVADDLSDRGYQVVLTGSSEECELCTEVASYVRRSVINLAGRTTLGAMAALIDGAALVVTNDTGTSHIAAALKKSSVVVHLGSDDQRWAPLNRSRHRLVSVDVPCRPCEYRTCPIGFPCATELSWDVVASVTHEMLATAQDSSCVSMRNGVIA